MTDYLSLKKRIFSKYLEDAPKVTGILPTAFLISDLYHFMKGNNTASLPPQKMQTIVRAWVSDPTSNAIPITLVNGFLGSSFFGACNNEWLQTTKDEFIITPLRSWYDSGEMGLKWKNGEVTLQGQPDEMAQKLFEEYKAMNNKMFTQIETKQLQSNRTPNGAIDPGVIMSILGNVYDPFVEEITTSARSDCNTVSCGYATLHELTNVEAAEIELYMETIFETYKDSNALVIGGAGSSDYVDLYKKFYDYERKLIGELLKHNESFDLWQTTFDKMCDELITFYNDFDSDIQMTKTMNYEKHSRKFIYAISFVFNRIASMKKSRFEDNEKMHNYAINKIREVFNYVDNNKNDMKKILNDYVNKIDSTIYYDALYYGKPHISKLTFDIHDTIMIKKMSVNDDDLKVETHNGSFTYMNNIATITDDTEMITYPIYKNKNYVLVGTVNFMHKLYDHECTNELTEEAKKNMYNAIMCIAYSFDFFIIDIEKCTFYGVQID
jgi:hypothetical protein